MKPLIQRLVESVGPSGYEKTVRNLIEKEIKGLADEIRVDPLGNLIVRKGQKTANGLRIILAAHMDEIGLMVNHIDENGFVRFVPIGGVFPMNCLGGRVIFTDGAHGVIGVEREAIKMPGSLPTLENLFIDVGVSNKKECMVKVGSVAAFDRSFLDLGTSLVSKAMDDRIGVAILVETLRQLKESPHEIYFVFTTQEEVGTRGAGPAAYSTNPDLGLSIDVTLTGDTPKGHKMAVSLGKGPAIKVRDSGMISDPRLVQRLLETAENAKIPYQLEVLEGGTTDARAIQVTRAGIPSGCISIPCRYVHTPSEMVNYPDVLNAVRLLVAFLSKPITL
jgi:putative aminopeptidase FrvX